MAVFKFKKTLLSVSEEVNTAQQGFSRVLLEGPQEGELAFKVWFDLTQSGGATSPTTKAVLQTSHDGEKWADVVESTELTADGALSEWKGVADVGPYVRAVTVLGGATLPNHTADVYLLSHNPFKLKSAS